MVVPSGDDALIQGKTRELIENAVEDAIEREKVANGLGDLTNGVPSFATGGQTATSSNGGQINRLETLEKSLRADMITNQRLLLSQLYVERGLIQTVVDVPVEDAFRDSFEIKSAQLSADDIEDLHAGIDEFGLAIEMSQGMKWMRLYGGGAVIVIDGGMPMDTPFDYDEIEQGDPIEFRAVEMWELLRDSGGTHQPELVPGDNSYNSEYFQYYGKRVHRSRVLPLRGKRAPSYLRPRLQGWGLSVVEAIVASINQFMKSNSLTFEVLDEFKLDVFSINGLNAALQTNQGFAQVQKRIAIANGQKNYLNALVMDTLDKHESKQVSFAGIAEMLKEFRIQLACDLRMPLTKLFGLSASGFNSGEDDMENYNAMVESEVRQKAKRPLIQMLKVFSKQRLGMVPDDLTIKFKPLRVLTAEQEETVKNSQMDRLLKGYEKGFATAAEAMDAINRASLFPIQVDPNKEIEEDFGDEAENFPGVERGADAEEEDAA